MDLCFEMVLYRSWQIQSYSWGEGGPAQLVTRCGEAIAGLGRWTQAVGEAQPQIFSVILLTMQRMVEFVFHHVCLLL